MTRGREVRRNVALAALLAAPLLVAYAMTGPDASPPASPANEVRAVATPDATRTVAALPTDPPPSRAPAFESVKPEDVAIEGTVVASDGKPVAGAYVDAQVEATKLLPCPFDNWTGTNGRFRVAVSPDSPVVLRVVTPGWPCGNRFPAARVRVPAGGTKDLIVRLQPGATIAGRVVDGDGNGVAGLNLRTALPYGLSIDTYKPWKEVTSADGSFAFDGLVIPCMTIVEDRPSGAVADHLLLDAADVPTQTRDLVVQRLPIGLVLGRVREADGSPVASRTVVLARKGAAHAVEAGTDAAGRFSAIVAVPGTYVVRLRVATQSGHADRDMGEIDASAHDRVHPFVAPTWP